MSKRIGGHIRGNVVGYLVLPIALSLTSASIAMGGGGPPTPSNFVHCTGGPCEGTNQSDQIFGSPQRDVIEGHQRGDRIHGGRGRDEVRGGLGWDWIYGDEDADELRGGVGDDFILGQGGGDAALAETLLGQDGSDCITGGPGEDRIEGGEDADGGGEGLCPAGLIGLEGDSDSDEIFGEEKRDVIEGGAGDDAPLNGGGGNDTIYAAYEGEPQGDDYVQCGAGSGDVAYVDKLDDVVNCETVHVVA